MVKSLINFRGTSFSKFKRKKFERVEREDRSRERIVSDWSRENVSTVGN